ncbi:MAG: alpha/beta fold hydrolase [Myxococcota bacterium]
MEWLHLGNRLVRRALVMRGVSSELVRLRGADVHYYRAEGRGDGPPLLLVHGLGSSANAFFRTLLPLSRTFRSVYALDLPGNGFSPVPAAGPMALREFVELLRDFRREVIRERVFLVGNSLGGGMALNFAFAEPSALVALGLVSPAGARVSDERFAQLLQSFHVTDRREARALAHKLFAKPPLGLLLFADELRKMVSTETVRSIVREVSPADMVSPAELARLEMPTLLVWGTREKLLPAEGLAFFREHLPAHAEVHEVDGFGHMPQMEHPEDFVERFRHFAHRQGLASTR